MRIRAGRAGGRTFTAWLYYAGSSYPSAGRTWTCLGVDGCADMAFITLGGPTDLWGKDSWSASEINSTNFGVRISSCEGEGTRYVDAVEVTVYYTVEDTTPPIAAPNT